MNEHQHDREIEMTLEVDVSPEARRQREQFDRNSAWLEAHASEVYTKHRGKCICIAGQELFVGETAKEVVARARAVHPEDAGWFTRYIPKEKVPRIYAVQW